MRERVVLTDRFIKSRPPAPRGERVSYGDALVPGLSLRVTDRGHKSFVLMKRFPLRPGYPSRRSLGDYGAITLEQARQKAREWLALVQRGIDPRTEEQRQRAEAERERTEEQRRQLNSFAAVAEEFLTRHAAKQAKAAEARRIIESEFVSRWGERPITEITRIECAAAISIIAKRAPAQAHNCHGYLRRLFRWTMAHPEFGLEASPVDGLKPTDLIGQRVARDRVLTDDELRRVWLATGGPVGAEAVAEARRRDGSRDALAPTGYPFGPLVRMLILTGQRLREVAEATWDEVDLDGAIWTIPATRMKSHRVHEVPLAPDALALLRSMPRFTDGDHIFSADAGRRPYSGFSKAKRRLDRVSGVTNWVLHDLRRSMRSGLSALPIEDRVREQMIAHAQPGLHRVYDRHSYRDEKRRGFELWEGRLRGIVEPKPADVTDIAAERDRRRA